MVSREINQAPLPLSINDEYLSTTEEGKQPEGKPSLIDFVIYTARIPEISDGMKRLMIKAQTDAHAANLQGKCHPGPDPTEVLRLNSVIDDFLHDLPKHINPETDFTLLGVDEDTADHFRVQAFNLKGR